MKLNLVRILMKNPDFQHVYNIIFVFLRYPLDFRMTICHCGECFSLLRSNLWEGDRAPRSRSLLKKEKYKRERKGKEEKRKKKEEKE